MKKGKPTTQDPELEKPPMLGSWKNLYLLLTGALVLQIIVYYLITISFR